MVAEDGAETITLLWNDVTGEVLRECLGSDPNENDRSYTEEAIMSILRLDA